MSRPPQEVKSKVHTIVTQLANVTGNIVVADTVGHHMESVGKTRPEWLVVLLLDFFFCDHTINCIFLVILGVTCTCI